ncbi:MAG: DUF5993 family protein [Halothiobacillaceae bacterium]
MMALPFFTLFAGLVAAWFGHPRWALGLWAGSLLWVFVLFLAHATDRLSLQF